MGLLDFFGSSSSSSPSSSRSASPSNDINPPRIASSSEAVVKASTNPLITDKNPTGVKPCCACPETKKARDDCFLKYGSNIDEDSESRVQCKDIVERHRECMRGFGFNV